MPDIPIPQSAVCLIYPVRSPQSAVRSPQSAVRSPQSAVRSPQSAVRSPQSTGCSPQSTVRSSCFILTRPCKSTQTMPVRRYARRRAFITKSRTNILLKNLTHPVCIARPTRFIRHIQGTRYYKICIHRKKSSSIRYSTRLMSVILRPRFSSFIRL